MFHVMLCYREIIAICIPEFLSTYVLFKYYDLIFVYILVCIYQFSFTVNYFYFSVYRQYNFD